MGYTLAAATGLVLARLLELTEEAMNEEARNVFAKMAATQVCAYFSERGRFYQKPREVLSKSLTFIGDSQPAWINLSHVLDRLKSWHELYTSGKPNVLSESAAKEIYNAFSAFNAWRAAVMDLGTNKWVRPSRAGQELLVWLSQCDYQLLELRPSSIAQDRQELERLRHDLRYATGDDRQEIEERIRELEG